MSFKEMFERARGVAPSNQQKKEFQTLPDGRYHAQVHNVSVDLMKDPVGVTIELKIRKCLTNEAVACEGRRVWANYWLSEKSLPFLIDAMKVLEVNTENVEVPEDLGERLFTTMNKEVIVYLKSKPGSKNPEKLYTSVYFDELVKDGGPQGDDDFPMF